MLQQWIGVVDFFSIFGWQEVRDIYFPYLWVKIAHGGKMIQNNIYWSALIFCYTFLSFQQDFVMGKQMLFLILPMPDILIKNIAAY